MGFLFRENPPYKIVAAAVVPNPSFGACTWEGNPYVGTSLAPKAEISASHGRCGAITYSPGTWPKTSISDAIGTQYTGVRASSNCGAETIQSAACPTLTVSDECADLVINQTSGSWISVTGCKKITCTQGGWGHQTNVACRVVSPNANCTTSDHAVTVKLNSTTDLSLTLKDNNCWDANKKHIGVTCNGTATVTLSVPEGKTIQCKGNENAD